MNRWERAVLFFFLFGMIHVPNELTPFTTVNVAIKMAIIAATAIYTLLRNEKEKP